MRRTAAGPAAGHAAPSTRIERRIKSPALRSLYLRWRADLFDRPGLPGTATFDFGELAAHSFMAAVEGESFTFVSVGRALIERLGRSPVGETFANDATELFGSLKATYRLCVEREAPCYEYLRHADIDAGPMLFERLTLPFFGAQGVVTHVGGVALFTPLAERH